MRTKARSSQARLRLGTDTRGAIMTEYAVVMGVCGLIVSLAIASLGAPLVAAYSQNRQTLMKPIP